MSTRNISRGGKGGRCVGVTLPPSCTDCLVIWEPKPPGTLKGFSRPVMGLLYLFIFLVHVFTFVLPPTLLRLADPWLTLCAKIILQTCDTTVSLIANKGTWNFVRWWMSILWLRSYCYRDLAVEGPLYLAHSITSYCYCSTISVALTFIIPKQSSRLPNWNLTEKFLVAFRKICEKRLGSHRTYFHENLYVGIFSKKKKLPRKFKFH
jgi:hypothetical protein